MRRKRPIVKRIFLKRRTIEIKPRLFLLLTLNAASHFPSRNGIHYVSMSDFASLIPRGLIKILSILPGYLSNKNLPTLSKLLPSGF